MARAAVREDDFGVAPGFVCGRLAPKLESAAASARLSRLAEVSKDRHRKAKRSRATKRGLVEGKRRRGETKQLRKWVS